MLDFFNTIVCHGLLLQGQTTYTVRRAKRYPKDRRDLVIGKSSGSVYNI